MTKTFRGLVLSVALATGALVGTGTAVAQTKPVPLCDGLISAPSMWELNYDPNGAPNVQDVFNVTLINNGGAACPGRLVVKSLNGDLVLRSTETTQTVPFYLHLSTPFRDVTPGPDDSQLNGTDISVPPGQQGILPVIFGVTPGMNLPAGRYTLPVELEFRTTNNRGNVIAKPVTLVLNVRSSAMLGIKGEFTRHGSAAVINLGSLETGIKTPATQVYVRSTSGYLLTVSSDNHGYLKHRLPGWSIRYNMRMGQHDIDLSVPYTINMPVPAAYPDDYPLSFSIGDVENMRAGRYSDTIRFELMAL
ncbi:hypothetical protein [uncultured Brevundimonas sp.]|uniref:hypothetical protein n=1 Tax=uncultured Brevundimonas sp. TaxID=213418 RepID=UPI00260B22CC|nr:hypothetical protein [uncultured Brevundimonas sp.]